MLNFLIGLFTSASIAISGIPLNAIISIPTAPLTASLIETVVQAEPAVKASNIPDVPFYSQFQDIHSMKWQKLGCGIASLAMLIDFYQPGSVSVDTLLDEGIAAGAFINGAGWLHKGLASLASQYGLAGASYDFAKLNTESAFTQLEKYLKDGPVIASVHYKLEPTNPIPHLIVINGIAGNTVYYNDPASVSGGKTISVQDFLKAWKKRFIAVRP